VSRLALLSALVALAAGCVAAPAADAEVQWLCRPGLASNPCQGDQTTTYFESEGTSSVSTPDVPADPPIDCFYATVSNQPTPNADTRLDFIGVKHGH